jgi:transposase
VGNTEERPKSRKPVPTTVRKGRFQLRKVLAQAACSLIQSDRLFAEYYRRRRAEGKGHWTTIVAIMRKLCKILYGLYKSGRSYDPGRVFTCESQYAAGG